MMVHGTTTLFRKQCAAKRPNSTTPPDNETIGTSQEGDKMSNSDDEPLPSKFARIAEDERKGLVLGQVASEVSTIRKSSRIAQKKAKIEAERKKREETALNETKHCQPSKKGKGTKPNLKEAVKAVRKSQRLAKKKLNKSITEDATSIGLAHPNNKNIRKARSNRSMSEDEPEKKKKKKAKNIDTSQKRKNEKLSKAKFNTSITEDESSIGSHHEGKKISKENSPFTVKATLKEEEEEEEEMGYKGYVKSDNKFFQESETETGEKKQYARAGEVELVDVQHESNHDYNLRKLPRRSYKFKDYYTLSSGDIKSNKMKRGNKIVSEGMIPAEVLDTEENTVVPVESCEKNAIVKQDFDEDIKPFCDDSEHDNVGRSPRTPKPRYKRPSCKNNKRKQKNTHVSESIIPAEVLDDKEDVPVKMEFHECHTKIEKHELVSEDDDMEWMVKPEVLVEEDDTFVDNQFGNIKWELDSHEECYYKKKETIVPRKISYRDYKGPWMYAIVNCMRSRFYNIRSEDEQSFVPATVLNDQEDVPI